MPTSFRVTILICVLIASGYAPGVDVATGFSQNAATLAAQEQPKQQEEFTPIDELPPQEQLPAAPLLVAAYAFVLLMLFGYMVTVSRRLSLIQREVDRLDTDVKRSGRS
jgi:CcmD family protein